MQIHPGDDGMTGIPGAGRVAKDDLRLEALGDLDEAMATLGIARALASRENTQRLLRHMQDELALTMGEVATADAGALSKRLGVTEVASLEADAEALRSAVGPLTRFVVPGATVAGAALHQARTVVRRAERRVVSLHAKGELGNPLVLTFLNRLSTVLFLLAYLEDRAVGDQRVEENND